MLKKDAEKAEAGIDVGDLESNVEKKPSSAAEEKVKLPPIKKSVAASQSTMPSQPAVTHQPIMHSQPTSQSQRAAVFSDPVASLPKVPQALPEPAAGDPIPIALGLDRFLASPDTASVAVSRHLPTFTALFYCMMLRSLMGCGMASYNACHSCRAK